MQLLSFRWRLIIGVAVLPYVISSFFVAPAPSIPNTTDQITKSKQAQELAVNKNMTKCLPVYNMHSGVPCLREDQQKINELKGNGMV